MRRSFEAMKVCARVLMRFPRIDRYRFARCCYLADRHASVGLAAAWEMYPYPGCCNDMCVRITAALVWPTAWLGGRNKYLADVSRVARCLPHFPCHDATPVKQTAFT